MHYEQVVGSLIKFIVILLSIPVEIISLYESQCTDYA